MRRYLSRAYLHGKVRNLTYSSEYVELNYVEPEITNRRIEELILEESKFHKLPEKPGGIPVIVYDSVNLRRPSNTCCISHFRTTFFPIAALSVRPRMDKHFPSQRLSMFHKIGTSTFLSHGYSRQR